MRVSGVVLAGGASRRMGRDKRFFPVTGKPLLVWVLDRLRPLVDELIVVAREPLAVDGLAARVVTDRYPGCGVLAGVHAGLSEAQGDWAVLVGGDMPLLNPALLRAMLETVSTLTVDALVPRWNGEFEPLHALYRPATCAPAAERALQRNQRRIIAFYDEIALRIFEQEQIARWDPEGRSFFNVNTPADLETLLDYLNADQVYSTSKRSGCE